jgi:hypothetical protein
MRIPMAIAPSAPIATWFATSGRQLLGYNPYGVVPADQSLTHTHTDQTARMPSRRDARPAAGGAALLPARRHDQRFDAGQKLALVVCDLLTMVVLWRWLAATNR